MQYKRVEAIETHGELTRFVRGGGKTVPYKNCENCRGNCNVEMVDGILYVFCNGDINATV